ncbi:SDR family NAD(P)-dependent oxidoreductase [Robertkochia flava]|uniref:SDR family NAD(P)-dependent oxidoreductase n=1 Tax=Robertkochia flava TaxID=3447986 RepID=UPI001CCFC12E|nr:SDR family NAD(P)-dependent oxidoreductase [Robertkochia marina]
MKKTAFITGASSGIGRAIARAFAKHEIRLVLCGRRQERLDTLKDELSPLTEVTTLCFDVRYREVVEKAIGSLDPAFSQIDILVNNAGNAHGLDLIDQGNPDDWDAMMDINVKGLLYVTHCILPQMMKRKAGQIINIGSTAGKEVYPKGDVYCASKHAVDAINQGMRLDLNGSGIRVGAINPGLVETEFSDVRFKGDRERAEKVYEGYTPLRPEDIAEIAYFMVSRPPHVNIADLMVMCTDQASSTIVNKKT